MVKGHAKETKEGVVRKEMEDDKDYCIEAEHMLSLNYSYFPFTRLLHLVIKHHAHLPLQPITRTV